MEVILDAPPVSINVVPALPPDECAVLLAAKLSLCTDRVVIPVKLNTRTKLYKLRSVHAATHGLPSEVKIIDHAGDLGFAATDFKVQSLTKTKLIMSLGQRLIMPHFVLSAIYVFAARVKLGNQLRVIGLNPQRDTIDHLLALQHPAVLGIWEASYDDNGDWCDERLADAIKAALGGDRPTPLEEEEVESEEEGAGGVCMPCMDE